MITDPPRIDPAHGHSVDPAVSAASGDPLHPPRMLILRGAVRVRSGSRAAGDAAARRLRWFGAEVGRFGPSGLPLPDDGDAARPGARGPRDLDIWPAGMIGSASERHSERIGSAEQTLLRQKPSRNWHRIIYKTGIAVIMTP